MSLLEQFKEQQAGFKQQSASGSINGVLVPVSINRNGGKLRLYISLDAGVLQSPQALEASLSELEQVFDLDTWQGSNNNQGGFKSGGGYQNNGGGYGNRNGYNNGYQKRW